MSLFPLDFFWKLRQSASAFQSHFVDADIPVTVLRATDSILDVLQSMPFRFDRLLNGS